MCSPSPAPRPAQGPSHPNRLRAVLRRLLRTSEGQDLIEYGLLIGMLSVTLVAALGPIGGKVLNYYTTLSASLDGNVPAGPPGGNPGGGNPGGGNPGGGNPGGGNPGGGNPGGGNPGGGNGGGRGN